jgi:hypothetical protein
VLEILSALEPTVTWEGEPCVCPCLVVLALHGPGTFPGSPLVSLYSLPPLMQWHGVAMVIRPLHISTWADDIRVQKPATGPWHFIDLPLGTTIVDPKYCPLPPGCVITAIQKDVATLRDANASAADRSVALLFLIHFVGDLHQPLHDTTNNDRGANCLPVGFFGQQPQELANENFKPNLHAVWDTDLVEKAMAGRSIADFAAYLDAKYPSSVNAWTHRPPNIFNWVSESHRIALAVVYGRLPVPVALEPPVAISGCSDDKPCGSAAGSLA